MENCFNMNRLLCLVPFVLNASPNLCHQFDLRKIKHTVTKSVEQWRKTYESEEKRNESTYTSKHRKSNKWNERGRESDWHERERDGGIWSSLNVVVISARGKSDFLPFLCRRAQRGGSVHVMPLFVELTADLRHSLRKTDRMGEKKHHRPVSKTKTKTKTPTNHTTPTEALIRMNFVVWQ